MFCYYLALCNSFTTPNDEAIIFFFFEKCHDCIFFLQFLVKCLFEAVIADRCNKKGTTCVKVTENNPWIHMHMLVTFLNVSLSGRSDLRFKATKWVWKKFKYITPKPFSLVKWACHCYNVYGVIFFTRSFFVSFIHHLCLLYQLFVASPPPSFLLSQSSLPSSLMPFKISVLNHPFS